MVTLNFLSYGNSFKVSSQQLAKVYLMWEQSLIKIRVCYFFRDSIYSTNTGGATQVPETNHLKGQCPDCAHARASSVFSSKDNRTVILTRQDFLPDRTADGELLFTISNILDL